MRVRESQNSNSRNHITEIFIDNLPFTLHPFVGLLLNSTTSEELLPPGYGKRRRSFFFSLRYSSNIDWK